MKASSSRTTVGTPGRMACQWPSRDWPKSSSNVSLPKDTKRSESEGRSSP